jgi:hypothetical protein
MIFMTPPHIHMHWSVLLSTGPIDVRQVGLVGIHGAGMAGTQGIGVKTPSAAAVAAATVGLDRVIHIPNGQIFRNGT